MRSPGRHSDANEVRGIPDAKAVRLRGVDRDSATAHSNSIASGKADASTGTGSTEGERSGTAENVVLAIWRSDQQRCEAGSVRDADRYRIEPPVIGFSEKVRESIVANAQSWLLDDSANAHQRSQVRMGAAKVDD